jgi:F420-non-reducing hydrogenase iron-sulfur subunit
VADFIQRGQQDPPGQGGLPQESQKALKEATLTEAVAGKDVEGKAGDFQPRVAAICCNWCTWSSLDEAGVGGHKFPPEVTVIRTLCSARIEPRNVINMLREGLDGVFVGACDKGSCHYLSGTNLAQKELGQLMEVLSSPSMGFKGRLKIGFFVGREGPLFARALTEFTNEVRTLGPSPMNTNPSYRSKPQAVAAAAGPAPKAEEKLVKLEDV